MVNFSLNDKEKLKDYYKDFLMNLREYLRKYDVHDVLEYSKLVLDMLHSGALSVDGVIKVDDGYDYIDIPSDVSAGVHITTGVSCCRHTTSFLYDLLNVLGFQSSLSYFQVGNELGIWHKVNPAEGRANHVVLSVDNLIVDPANKFILEELNDGRVCQIDLGDHHEFSDYQDKNIISIDKVLKKYYTYRNLGIERVYD